METSPLMTHQGQKRPLSPLKPKADTWDFNGSTTKEEAPVALKLNADTWGFCGSTTKEEAPVALKPNAGTWGFTGSTTKEETPAAQLPDKHDRQDTAVPSWTVRQ